VDLILTALAPALPEKIPAGHKGDMGGYAFHGVDPRTGRRFLCQSIMGGGWGGRPHEDGESATVSVCQGDVQNAPVELQELNYPLLFEFHRLREGSGGSGKFRGGLGIEIVVRLLCDGYANINVERNLCPPWGIGGGESGKPAKALVRQSPEDSGRWITKGRNTPVKKGGSVTFLTAGGGGYGPSAERAPALIERDLRRGYVRRESSKP
jgi:N-methylhydantoinase B